MRTRKTFTLTPDHMKLVRHFYVGWQYCETGAPEIDPKRPYGNSDVEWDVAELLGWDWDRADDLPDSMRAAAATVHRETEHALQIVLQHGPFIGVYGTEDPWSSVWSWIREWEGPGTP